MRLTNSQKDAMQDESVVPVCYMGHDHCWDTHEAEQRADDNDYIESLSDEPWIGHLQGWIS